MQINGHVNKRGDTLIEVLFAVTVFSLVVVGALSIMNQGTDSAQRALEITLVREQIDAQAETLRFLNASYIESPGSDQGKLWSDMSKTIIPGGSASDFVGGQACPTIRANSMIMNTKTAEFDTGKYTPAPVYSRVTFTGNQVKAAEGIWIEAVKATIPIGQNQDNADYIDFHIRACWDSPGQSEPVTLGTIVRLYEPK